MLVEYASHHIQHTQKALTHFHVWHYKRDSDGVIRSMERRPEHYEKRRAANRALEMFRRKHCIADQVLQCVDGAFCEPPRSGYPGAL